MIEFLPLKSLDDPPLTTYARHYLGLSGIGQECSRKTILAWLWTKKTGVNGRIQRIFDYGHAAEDYLIEQIQSKSNCKVIHYGENQLELTGHEGHWIGHPDGILIADGVPFLLEIKTHNDASYKKLDKEGVKTGHPAHYDQMQSYMDFDVIPSQGIYLAINKNTSELYIEIIEIDFNRIELLREKQRHLLDIDQLPERIGNNKQTYYKCKMCEYAPICFEKEEISTNCRTCKYCAIMPGGEFHCNGTDTVLTMARQLIGCEAYELDEGYFKL